MKIGLFGGSFNPPHRGHRTFASVFKAQGLLDQVWILVSPDPPHKDGENLVPYEHRHKMALLNFEGLDGVLINQIEEDLPAPHYTVHTLKHLKKNFPDVTFFLCLGEDSIRSFESWKSPNEILDMVEILVVRRDHTSTELPKMILDNSHRIHWLDAKTESVSSSLVRKYLQEGRDISEYLDSRVFEYIQTHKLYRS